MILFFVFPKHRVYSYTLLEEASSATLLVSSSVCECFRRVFRSSKALFWLYRIHFCSWCCVDALTTIFCYCYSRLSRPRLPLLGGVLHLTDAPVLALLHRFSIASIAIQLTIYVCVIKVRGIRLYLEGRRPDQGNAFLFSFNTIFSLRVVCSIRRFRIRL
jgi:hypothetical protein